MSSVTVETPGKLNLVLDVLGKRRDGFHEIDSLMVGVGLRDRLVIETAVGDVPEVHCSSADVPADASNLVCRAACCLARRLKRLAGCRITLDKKIPVGGGMGGGSSDAAATLAGLNGLWNGGLSSTELAAVGADIGSDVPFFFELPSASVSGRGERVAPLSMKWKGWVVLVMAGVLVSTKEVYSRCVSQGKESRGPSIRELAEVETAEALQAGLRNDLEEAVFAVAPAVGLLYSKLADIGMAHVRVSGAGSVLFGLYDDRADACEMLTKIRSSGAASSAMVAEAPVS